MVLEPTFEEINYKVKDKILTEQIRADSKTDVIAEGVSGILSVNAWAVINDVTVGNGRVDYVGKVIYYVSYLSTEGEIKKVECGNEFSGTVKDAGITAEFIAQAEVTVDKWETDTSGLKLSVGGYLTVKIALFKTATFSALSGGENIIVDKREVNYVKSLGVKQAIYPLEEEFELDYTVEEVLSHRADAIITAVQCGVGRIIVDGEVLLSAIMLQKNQKRDIIRENKSLPFKMEIECDEAMPAFAATARVIEKSFKSEVFVDEEKENSVVRVEVNLKFEGEAFITSEVLVAADAFSLEQNIELEREEVPYQKACELRCVYAVVSGRSAVRELEVGSVLLAVHGERAEILNKVCTDKGLKVEGVLSAIGYFKENERFFTLPLETPFEVTLDCVYDCDVEIDLVAKAQKAHGRILTLTEVEIEGEIVFNVYPTENKRLQLVRGVKTLGEKAKKSCALSVYIPLEGEELWSLSKRLNVSPETLVETNKDLCFPLTGKERIVIYRQK